MVAILCHGDGDGITSAALVKMTKQYRNTRVIFTHPMGIARDLQGLDEELVIVDIAIDERSYKDIYAQLDAISQNFPITYIDHHRAAGPLPAKVNYVYNQETCAAELVYRFFYHQLPKWADRWALIGAICDYMDQTPLMQNLLVRFERRPLYLEAGLVSQGIRADARNYEELRKLVDLFAINTYPCEIPTLVKSAMITTREDKDAKKDVLKNYQKGETIAWVINPQASKTKAAHWVMGDSNSFIGLTVIKRESKPDIVDITIRGRGMVDLRDLIPKIALNLGGSGGGLFNAIGCRIPVEKLGMFLKILDGTIKALKIPPPPEIDYFIPIPDRNKNEKFGFT